MSQPSRVRSLLVAGSFLLVGVYSPALPDTPPTKNSCQLLFDSDRVGHREIYRMQPDGSGVVRLTFTPGGHFSAHPHWSPDGNQIVFMSDRDWTSPQGSSVPHVLEIYVMDADGGNVRRITHTPGEAKSSWGPQWSPDGKKNVFVSDRDGNPEIYVMNVGGSGVQRLTQTPGAGASNWHPAWSPDGTRIAFSAVRDEGSRLGQQIYVMNADGSDTRRLTQPPGEGNTPQWSPDGTKIAFASNRHAGLDSSAEQDFEIYIMNADGSEVRRLGAGWPGSSRPHWSCDGTQIAFQAPYSQNPKDLSNYEIHVMDVDGSNVRRLIFNEVFDGHPDWGWFRGQKEGGKRLVREHFSRLP